MDQFIHPAFQKSHPTTTDGSRFHLSAPAPNYDPTQNIGEAPNSFNLNVPMNDARPGPSSERETTTSAGRSRKRKNSDRDATVPPGRPRAKRASLKKISCEKCRSSKKRCEFSQQAGDGDSCKYCVSKGLNCTYAKVDGRTNETESAKLGEVLLRYRALAAEFFSLLEVMSLQSHTQMGQSARERLCAGESPSAIVSRIIPTPGLFEVESIPALRKLDGEYGNLPQRRQAVVSAEKAGREIIASIACLLTRCLNNELAESEASRILASAGQGGYRADGNLDYSTYHQQLDKWYPGGLKPMSALQGTEGPKPPFLPPLSAEPRAEESPQQTPPRQLRSDLVIVDLTALLGVETGPAATAQEPAESFSLSRFLDAAWADMGYPDIALGVEDDPVLFL